MNESRQPLISVVLCFYNEQRFIKEAIESVLRQTYEHWELLLVDDGSSDKSTLIAKAYALRYPKKIFYVQHEGHLNKGLSASRNKGIKRARGSYIAFLDADDVWLADKLTNQIAIFDQHPTATVILEASHYWKSWTETNESDVIIPVGVTEGLYAPPSLMVSLYPLGKGAAPCPSGIIVHHSVFKKALFEESFRGIHQMYEDQAFLCKLYLNENVFVSAACHNLYRQRPASLVSRVHDSGKYDVVRKFYLEWFTRYLNQRKVRNQKIERLLQKALMPYKQPLIFQLRNVLPGMLKKIIAKLLIRLGILTYRKSW